MKRLKNAPFVFALLLGLALIFGMTGIIQDCLAANEPETFSCVAEGNLYKEVAPEAALEEFACFFKKWDGSETIHFKVSLKNVSDKPQRFRVNIFLDNGKGVGGYLPRKTKKGLVQPGETAGFVYPVKGMPDKPGTVTLIIKTMSQ